MCVLLRMLIVWLCLYCSSGNYGKPAAMLETDLAKPTKTAGNQVRYMHTHEQKRQRAHDYDDNDSYDRGDDDGGGDDDCNDDEVQRSFLHITLVYTTLGNTTTMANSAKCSNKLSSGITPSLPLCCTLQHACNLSRN